jgi:hypothetical protein
LSLKKSSMATASEFGQLWLYTSQTALYEQSGSSILQGRSLVIFALVKGGALVRACALSRVGAAVAIRRFEQRDGGEFTAAARASTALRRPWLFLPTGPPGCWNCRVRPGPRITI